MVDAVRDLNSRFSRVFIAKKGAKVNKPFFVDQFFINDRGVLTLRTYNRETEEIEEMPFNEDDFILDCPPVGMVFDGDKAYYLRRTPDRQWKRGYNNNVIRMTTLSSIESRELGLVNNDQNSKKIVDFVFNPKFVPLGEGLEGMSKSKIFSFPISRKYAIALRSTAKYPVIYYKEWIVGWVEDGEMHLTEETNHLFEELSQYGVCRRA